jgi:CTP:molybdopterin cytidylyltransferase MocA
MIPRPWVVLLAAGASRRFGGPKQLARVGGESLLRHMARVALACGPAGCVVVLGARAPRLRRELAGLGVRAVVNPRWREGISRSLAAGVAALPADAQGALVLLADQAALGPADLEVLCACWRKSPRRMVAVRTGSTLGPPAILPRSVFPALRRLRGDHGARELLRDPRRCAIGIELPGAALDIDRPSDLAALSRTGRDANSRAP